VPESIEQKVLSRIYGNGKGLAFSKTDFTGLGSRSAIESSLFWLKNLKTIRSALRGLYDYPRYSEILEHNVGPDVDQIAHALAWRIQPDGATAQNLLGLSTQVPAQTI